MGLVRPGVRARQRQETAEPVHNSAPLQRIQAAEVIRLQDHHRGVPSPVRLLTPAEAAGRRMCAGVRRIVVVRRILVPAVRVQILSAERNVMGLRSRVYAVRRIAVVRRILVPVVRVQILSAGRNAVGPRPRVLAVRRIAVARRVLVREARAAMVAAGHARER